MSATAASACSPGLVSAALYEADRTLIFCLALCRGLGKDHHRRGPSPLILILLLRILAGRRHEFLTSNIVNVVFPDRKGAAVEARKIGIVVDRTCGRSAGLNMSLPKDQLEFCVSTITTKHRFLLIIHYKYKTNHSKTIHRCLKGSQP